MSKICAISLFWFESFCECSYSDESPLIPNEFLHEPHITAQDLGGEPILGLMVENECDLWIQYVPSNVKRSLKEKQVSILPSFDTQVGVMLMPDYCFGFELFERKENCLCSFKFNFKRIRVFRIREHLSNVEKKLISTYEMNQTKCRIQNCVLFHSLIKCSKWNGKSVSMNL